MYGFIFLINKMHPPPILYTGLDNRGIVARPHEEFIRLIYL
jgi:hypothetical protein